jgi:hypothetical protein
MIALALGTELLSMTQMGRSAALASGLLMKFPSTKLVIVVIIISFIPNNHKILRLINHIRKVYNPKLSIYRESY